MSKIRHQSARPTKFINTKHGEKLSDSRGLLNTSDKGIAEVSKIPIQKKQNGLYKLQNICLKHVAIPVLQNFKVTCLSEDMFWLTRREEL